ncbi:chitin-inducible gibberellin-responsive protein 1-like [Pyrus ussuriensis x Pyrus communis]|uniref:Chitin-inducible gibberellin-responsive protein 1-like n=1 Tax=Pyrus ussuriensis x Pyrus communis TaxID=2448454 RepID=A0A5N5GJL8_9ROSA|nr:chitin-inducible gibberellin-responsive protein 1 [Pyrus x bretschneideri]KAB2615756.1 chitin-inducible gibberellin-responsive protein 1-like [Pyrus ussuriensis x Pyrus communis]
MDQHFRFRATGAGLSHTAPLPTVQSLPKRLLGTLKFDIKNSSNTPFSTDFDSDTLTTLSNSQEQHSSPENLSGATPSGTSSFETNSYVNRLSLSPSVDCSRDSLQVYSGRASSLTDANSSQNIKQTLQELESALMGPDDEEEVTTANTSSGESSRRQTQRSMSWIQEHQGSNPVQRQTSFVSRQRQLGEAQFEKRHKVIDEASLKGLPASNLKELLIACAGALSNNEVDSFEKLIEIARGAVSIGGEPIQRLGAYLVEGLVARKEASGANIYHALRCREPESNDLLSYMQILYEICPYLKFGYMAANGAIAEACRNEDRIHIIDFQIAQGTQWVTLLQALAARPSGAPHVRITGIDDPVSKHARGDGLEAVGRRLKAISDKFNIPVEFHGVPVFAPDVTRDMLDVRPGEALAVNFPLQLHHTPDESVDENNPRDGLLRTVRSLNPKVTTLVEQESNTNTTPFFNRFVETLEYYLAMFESIDVTLPRNSKERINVEQHCLARDIVNVIACEGKERVERHELFGKWKSRLTMAGFQQYPLSSYVNSVIGSLLRCYSEHYTLVEKDGAMLLGWKDRNLISASAWH